MILGCAHAGIINTLHHITAQTRRPVHAVIGGTHLLQASKERLENTLTELRRINPEILAPSHCTGPKATAMLWTMFPQSIVQAHVGQTWTFAAA
ncbi:MAG: hypothetical protein HC898_08020 [Phycisphaerales bacterium]|nr:hypothetical protein [Phycisphaerales bacterium]